MSIKKVLALAAFIAVPMATEARAACSFDGISALSCGTSTEAVNFISALGLTSYSNSSVLSSLVNSAKASYAAWYDANIVDAKNYGMSKAATFNSNGEAVIDKSAYATAYAEYLSAKTNYNYWSGLTAQGSGGYSVTYTSAPYSGFTSSSPTSGGLSYWFSASMNTITGAMTYGLTKYAEVAQITKVLSPGYWDETGEVYFSAVTATLSGKSLSTNVLLPSNSSTVTPFGKPISGYPVSTITTPPVQTPGPLAGAGIPAFVGLMGFGLWRRRNRVA